MSIINGNLEVANPKYYNDFILFAKDLLKYHGEYRCEFGFFHKEAYESWLKNRYSLTVLPRGHLKSTLINCYVIWRLFRETNYEICLVSATLSQSKKNLDWIQDMIVNTSWLSHLVPDDSSYSWNKERIVTKNRNKCYIKPFKDSAKGSHPHETIFDDILRDENTTHEEIKEIFYTVFFPMAQTIQGKKIIVGTPLTTEDLFHELKSICEDNKKSGKPFDYSTDWNVLWYPCILDYGLKTERPLWKERYTLKELYSMRKQMGEYMFNQEMMCNPIEVGSGFFPREFILNACDDTLGFSYNTDGITYLGCDFAVSESVTGDYNVFVVVDSINGNIKRKFDFGDGEVELEVENPVIIRYIDRFKGGVGQVDRIEELAKRYNVSKIIVDGTGFGFRFAQEIRDRGLSVDAQNFAPANRSNLLVNLRKLFETTNVKTNPPRLVIPTSQKDGSYNVTKVLINELSGFVETKTRGGFSTIASKLKHDDTVMALALAVKDIVSSRKIVGKIFWEIKKDNKSIRSVPFFK